MYAWYLLFKNLSYCGMELTNYGSVFGVLSNSILKTLT